MAAPQNAPKNNWQTHRAVLMPPVIWIGSGTNEPRPATRIAAPGKPATQTLGGNHDGANRPSEVRHKDP
jgi:hypothetical protein